MKLVSFKPSHLLLLPDNISHYLIRTTKFPDTFMQYRILPTGVIHTREVNPITTTNWHVAYVGKREGIYKYLEKSLEKSEGEFYIVDYSNEEIPETS